jgi:protease-4
MAGRHRFLKSVVYLAAFAFFFLLAVTLYTYFSEGSLRFAAKNSVAIVNVEGVIEDSQDVVDALDRVAEIDAIRAVVLRVDSPGGGVAPSQEIYDAVLRLREHKPVVASLGGLAASGGYYVASGCDQIVANAGTLTGSIGVIMSLGNIEELLKKVGLQGVVVKAGKYKDIGSPMRPMTAEERKLLEDLLENVHGQFIAAVSKGRGMPLEDVRKVADGRIYSGEQALELRLVDRLGGLRDAVDLAAQRAGIQGKPRSVEVGRRRTPWWWRQIFGLLEEGSGGLGGLRFLYTGPSALG